MHNVTLVVISILETTISILETVAFLASLNLKFRFEI